MSIRAGRADVFRQARRNLSRRRGASFRDLLDGRLRHLPASARQSRIGQPSVYDLFRMRLKNLPWKGRRRRWTTRSYNRAPRTLCRLSMTRGAWTEPIIDKDWSAEDVRPSWWKLRQSVEGGIQGRQRDDVAVDMLALARAGLERRSRLDALGSSEAIFLKPLEEIAPDRRTIGVAAAQSFHENWRIRWNRPSRNA